MFKRFNLWRKHRHDDNIIWCDCTAHDIDPADVGASHARNCPMYEEPFPWWGEDDV